MSDLGIGAELFQRLDNRLNLCAFLSFKISPAERNYDVRDPVQLAINVAS